MKEFDKWLREGSWKDYVNSIEDDDLLNELQENAAKEGWKAALECVKKEMDAHEAGQPGPPYRIIYKCIYMMINEELNAKT